MLYYEAPTNEQFNELKSKAIELWTERYPPEKSPFYAEEKVNRIKDIKNVEDNFMYIVAMFDQNNQRLLANKLSSETSLAVRDRMISGGQPEYLIPF